MVALSFGLAGRRLSDLSPESPGIGWVKACRPQTIHTSANKQIQKCIHGFRL